MTPQQIEILQFDPMLVKRLRRIRDSRETTKGGMMATVSKYQTAKGERYRVRYRTPDGRSTDKRGFQSKDAAEKWANHVEVDMMAGKYVSPAAGLVTARATRAGVVRQQDRRETILAGAILADARATDTPPLR